MVDALRQAEPPMWIGEAVKGLGGDAADLLPQVLTMFPRLPGARRLPGPPDNRIPQCIGWIGLLGVDGAPAVLLLVEFLNAGRATLAVTAALANLGPPAAPAADALRRVLTSADINVRSQAAFALWHATGDLASLISVARDIVVLPRRSHAIRSYLERVGHDAAELAPALLPELVGRDPWNRVSTARTYWKLTGDTDTVLPVLLELAAPTPAGAAAVEALGWLGPLAVDVVPQLQGWLSQDERTAGAGTVGDTVERDEKFQELARNALAAITGV